MKLVFLILGFVLGSLAQIAWHTLAAPTVIAVGTLQYEPPVDPSVTPSYPRGYYVNSRIYLETADPDRLGKRVGVWGRPGVASYLDGPSYPKIRNERLSGGR